MNSDITPVLIIMLLCSLATVTHMQSEQETTDYDICEEGLTFVTLEVTPQFDSAAQADFYIKQYKKVAEGCVNGRLG